MAKKIYLTKGAKGTEKVGFFLARKLKKKKAILALFGTLGSGKTTFIKGFARALGIKEKILSPTFILLRKFKFNKKNFYHLDCFRIEKKDFFKLDFHKLIKEKAIIAIEWAEKIEKFLPREAIRIYFKFEGKNKRKITICYQKEVFKI